MLNDVAMYAMFEYCASQAAEETDVVRQQIVYNAMMLRRGLQAVDAVACSNPQCDNRYHMTTYTISYFLKLHRERNQACLHIVAKLFKRT
jgi:hypothetical protein